MTFTHEELIRMLDLQPLPGEGGHIRRTWSRPGNNRLEATCVYYLVSPDDFSSLHKLDATEIFHFYAGDACEMLIVGSDGIAGRHVLGNDLAAGMRPQIIVPSGAWQATRLIEGGRWALLGTTMSPGFDANGFTLATRNDLADIVNPTTMNMHDLLSREERDR